MTITPKKIRLEASSFCQLRCPSCPTTSKAIHPTIGSGFLKLSTFQKLLDENPWISEVELANYGEIFLNPELLAIIKDAYRRNVLLKATTGVNLNDVKEDVIEGLVKYKFRSMACSIDGASQNTYKIYRVRGHFEHVIENIRKINSYKQQYKSQYPMLTWQFVVFGHNEHEIPTARKRASELNMDFRLKLNWDAGFSPVRDKEFVRKQVGAASREEYKLRKGVAYAGRICHQLWEEPQINWNGKLLGCSRNFWGDFGGNVFTDGLMTSMNNEKIKYARDMLLGKKIPRADIPCTTCDIYLTRAKGKKWVKRGWSRLLYRAGRTFYHFFRVPHMQRSLRTIRMAVSEYLACIIV